LANAAKSYTLLFSEGTSNNGSNDHLVVKQAAEFLGVSPATLRRWDKAGKLKAIKNPMNNYRLYRKDKLEAFLQRLGEKQSGEERGMKKAELSFHGPVWRHPGGKLRELGPETLTDAELLAILISSGIKGKPAEEIAGEILERFGSFKGMANQPLEKFLGIKGLSDVKITRIAAAFEIARRIVREVLDEHEKA